MTTTATAPTALSIAIDAISTAGHALDRHRAAAPAWYGGTSNTAERRVWAEKLATLTTARAAAETAAAAELALRPDVRICTCGHPACEFTK